MGKIEDQIPVDLKSAMLAKDKVKLAALRAVKSAFLLEKTKEGFSGNISDDQAQQIISKLHKQRMDAYQIYIDQKRDDLATEEIEQANVLEIYLPKKLPNKVALSFKIKVKGHLEKVENKGTIRVLPKQT